MPEYLNATELTLLLPQNIDIGASTLPLALGEITTMITEIEAELDSAAAVAGYAVPVSSSATSGFALMQKWTRDGAAARVLGVLFPGMGGPGASGTLASEYRAAYQAALAALRKGEMALVGAAEDTTGTGVRELPRSYSTSNSGATTGILPHVTLDTVF